MYKVKIEDEQGNLIDAKDCEMYLVVVGIKQPTGDIGGCSFIRGAHEDLLRMYLGLGVYIYRDNENKRNLKPPK